jgi:hypothetical protein
VWSHHFHLFIVWPLTELVDHQWFNPLHVHFLVKIFRLEEPESVKG